MQYKLKCQAFSILNISQVIFVAPNSLIRSYPQPYSIISIMSGWGGVGWGVGGLIPSLTLLCRGDESEAMAPIISLYQTVDAQKGEVFFPDLLT